MTIFLFNRCIVHKEEIFAASGLDVGDIYIPLGLLGRLPAAKVPCSWVLGLTSGFLQMSCDLSGLSPFKDTRPASLALPWDQRHSSLPVGESLLHRTASLAVIICKSCGMASMAGLSSEGGLAAQPGFTERLDIFGIDNFLRKHRGPNPYQKRCRLVTAPLSMTGKAGEQRLLAEFYCNHRQGWLWYNSSTIPILQFGKLRLSVFIIPGHVADKW